MTVSNQHLINNRTFILCVKYGVKYSPTTVGDLVAVAAARIRKGREIALK